MSDRSVRPYGAWPSPITAAMVAEASVSLREVRLHEGAAYWVEARPLEEGRQVIVRCDPFAEPVDVTPSGFSARTTLHEYGGGDYWLDGDAVVFANFDDQRLWRQPGSGGDPVPITPDTGGRHRYADGRPVPNSELLVCVRERHDGGEPVNELVALPADGSAEPWVIAGGHDFFAAPRPSPDGSALAWMTWDHPSMPWDDSQLRVSPLDELAHPTEPRTIAGGPGESVQQPAWSPQGDLHLVSDRSGWWNLYRVEGADLVALAPTDAEFGCPMWVLGLSTYGFLDDGRIACAYDRRGTLHVAVLDPDGDLLDLDLPYSAAPWNQPDLATEGSRIALIAGGPAAPHAVAVLDFGARSVDVLRESGTLGFDASYVSEPRAVEFPTQQGRTAHVYVYDPVHPDVEAPRGERPPLLVVSHGGPTGAASAELDLEVQFWTSRGFAVVDVNYSGSTGFGRAYRELLKGRWGVLDVADCIAAAAFVADSGLADRDRLAIRGGSAGGYTTLCALTFHDGVFAAGASYYGVADIESLARDTHKFESRYLDGLIGPYPDAADLYRARSPLHFTDLLSCPLILFQGLEDEVVPPAQAETMVAALRAKGLPHAYVAFEGEQHGFRRAETIVRALEAELFFYSRVFGFDAAGDPEPVPIENL